MTNGNGILLANTGAMIAEARRSLGISQEELGALSGLHRNTIGKLERGEVDPALTGINRIYVQLQIGGVSFTEDGVFPGGPLCEVLANSYGAFSPMRAMEMIASRVRALRKRSGLSLEALARAANVHLNTVWGFENQAMDPSLITTYRIYRALGVTRVCLEEDGLHLLCD
jgi:transcriptional regulator with XRE-family HTH domain